MDETQEARRKRLKALQTSADDHQPTSNTTDGIQLPNPLADERGSGPNQSTVFPSGTQPRQFPTQPQPPPPPPDDAYWQQKPLQEMPMPGIPTSFGHQHPPQYQNRGGRGGGGRQGGWGRQQQGRGRGGRRGSGGGQFGGGAPSRGRGRPRNEEHGSDIEAYVSPEMVSNPWARLESNRGPPRAGNAQLASGGRTSEEGAFDRPWH